MMAYNTLKNGTRMKILNVPRFIFQRLLRILPTMVVLFIIIVTISRRVGSGPIYQLGVQQARQSCLDHWLSYFFFFQNYSNPDNMVMQYFFENVFHCLISLNSFSVYRKHGI